MKKTTSSPFTTTVFFVSDEAARRNGRSAINFRIEGNPSDIALVRVNKLQSRDLEGIDFVLFGADAESLIEAMREVVNSFPPLGETTPDGAQAHE